MSFYSVQQPILLIEDSPEDVQAIERILRQSGFKASLHACHNGDEALNYLRSSVGCHPENRPGLILMDLNMPGTDGLELLRLIKRNEALCMIPIVVLTTSSNPKDINECYCAGANSYSIKPVDYNAFKQTVAVILDYWFGITLLPD